MIKLLIHTGSSNGRTTDSESVNLGSNPGPVAISKSDQRRVIFNQVDRQPLLMSTSSNFDQLSSELINIFSKAQFEFEGRHSLDVLNWVKIIDPNASESLQIAALAHDLDRGIAPMTRKKDNETYDEYKQRHAKRSSQLIAKLMTKLNFSESTISRTVELVKNHEVGGDRESDILMDADSISFFSCNIDWYYKSKDNNIESTSAGIKYKYKRATPRAKKIIRGIEIKNKTLRNVCVELFKKN